MAKATLAATRNPADPLRPFDQEQVYHLIRRAQAVALLLETDPEPGGDITKDAAGAISSALADARRIMETGASEAAHG